MTNAFLTHHEKDAHTRHHKVFLSLQGWTDQEMTHKQDVCKKSGSSPHKVRKKSAEGLSMYNVNTPPRTTLLFAGWADATTLYKIC